MGSNTWNPEEWPSIVDDIRSGGASAGRRLLERERLHDNIFQTLDESYFSPVIVQNATTVTYTDWIFKGYRIGNFVNLEMRVLVTNTPGIGGIDLYVPTSLPIAQSTHWDEGAWGGPIVGTVIVKVGATDTWYSGMARSVASGLSVFGTLSATNTTMGSIAPVVGLLPVVGADPADQVGYHISYITSAIL